MNPISAIIVVKDNPPHIIETIESIQNFVKEVVVVDIGIDLNLKKKLSSYSSLRFFDIPKRVQYVELIREELKQQAKEEWVLFLDPDEVLTHELKSELSNNLLKCDYFSIPRKNIIFGKWIQHSRWWPDYQVRLFKKKAVAWPKEIHKQPLSSGKEYKIAEIENLSIVHYNYESLDEYVSKAVRYAKSEASEKIKESSYSLPQAIKNALSEFISRFFALDGYKDGMHGFVLAFLQMFYGFLVFFYWWEMKKYPNVETNKLTSEINTFFSGGLYEAHYWMNYKEIKKTGLKGKLLAKLLKSK